MPAEYATNRMTPRQRRNLNRSKLLHDLAIPFLIVGVTVVLFACCGCEWRNPNTVPNAHVVSHYGEYRNCHVLTARRGTIRLITQDGKPITIQGNAEVHWFSSKEEVLND